MHVKKEKTQIEDELNEQTNNKGFDKKKWDA